MKRAILICMMAAVLCGCRDSEKSYFGVYAEVPVSEIRAEGWLRGLLEIQRDGLGLHRGESGYPYNTCLWAGTIPKGGNPIAQAWWPYEQSGYIVDGLYRCGILLGDTVLTGLGHRNAAYVLEHPRANGMLGPEALGDAQWAFSVFARALLADYDVTGDRTVLDRLMAHFAALPDSLTNRQTCIVESMCKVYSHTGNKAILERAEQIWRTFSMPGTADNEAFRHADMVAAAPVEVHGVTAAEVSKQPAILYLHTGRPEYLAAAEGFYASVERDHELVDGIPTSCEKLLGKAPEALHETCDISDFMWSYGYMLMATGDVRWADKLENAFYNAALGAVSKDFRAHQYFSSPNQIVATQFSSAADYGEEGLLRQAYRPGFDTECCSGNVHRMFPNYASRMWLRDTRGGIVAALYAPGRLSTQAGDRSVAVLERTDYPFRSNVEFEFECSETVKFPFTVRIPAWAEGATVRVNGESPVEAAAGTFYTVDRRPRYARPADAPPHGVYGGQRCERPPRTAAFLGGYCREGAKGHGADEDFGGFPGLGHHACVAVELCAGSGYGDRGGGTTGRGDALAGIRNTRPVAAESLRGALVDSRENDSGSPCTRICRGFRGDSD